MLYWTSALAILFAGTSVILFVALIRTHIDLMRWQQIATTWQKTAQSWCDLQKQWQQLCQRSLQSSKSFRVQVQELHAQQQTHISALEQVARDHLIPPPQNHQS